MFWAPEPKTHCKAIALGPNTQTHIVKPQTKTIKPTICGGDSHFFVFLHCVFGFGAPNIGFPYCFWCVGSKTLVLQSF